MLFIFMLILGDSVVIWRTWALFRSAEKWLIAPALTWIGSVVAALYELGCDVKNGWSVQSNNPSAGSVGLESCAKADTASFSLSYATNIICTGLIMYKAWMYRRSMAEYLGSARRRTQVEKIMTLLVESGAIYLALYTFQAVPIYGGHFSAGSFIAVDAVNAIIQQAMVCHCVRTLSEVDFREADLFIPRACTPLQLLCLLSCRSHSTIRVK